MLKKIQNRLKQNTLEVKKNKENTGDSNLSVKSWKQAEKKYSSMVL